MVGIRLALGATPAEMKRLVLGEAASLVAIAMVIGGVVAVSGSRIMARLLFGITPTDWPTFASVVALLAAVTGLASYAPARRATRIDPTTTLRAD